MLLLLVDPAGRRANLLRLSGIGAIAAHRDLADDVVPGRDQGSDADILREHGYPPDLQDAAVQTVLQQA